MEGSRVRYVGEDAMIGAGSLGTVVASAGYAQHVRWSQGSRTGQIDLVSGDDLVPDSHVAREITTAVRAAGEQVMEPYPVPGAPWEGGQAVLAVREVYDDFGEEGVLNTLSEAGHLASLAEYAAEAVEVLSARLRSDASFSSVLAQLDPADAEGLVSRVTGSLLSAATAEES